MTVAKKKTKKKTKAIWLTTPAGFSWPLNFSSYHFGVHFSTEMAVSDKLSFADKITELHQRFHWGPGTKCIDWLWGLFYLPALPDYQEEAFPRKKSSSKSFSCLWTQVSLLLKALIKPLLNLWNHNLYFCSSFCPQKSLVFISPHSVLSLIDDMKEHSSLCLRYKGCNYYSVLWGDVGVVWWFTRQCDSCIHSYRRTNVSSYWLVLCFCLPLVWSYKILTVKFKNFKLGV